jgi:glucose/arabinose dehydrogenase
VQERDGLGDDLVPDYLIRVKEGGFYGWPYAYAGSNPQPGFAAMAPEKVAASIAPDLVFEPHSATMDFVFMSGARVPADYRGDAIVALRGSWNRSRPTGYKVVRVKFENGRPAGWYDNFMTGFWTEGEDKALVWGRPVDVALAPDGMLFVVDDTGGTIWRVTPKADREATGSTGSPPRASNSKERASSLLRTARIVRAAHRLQIQRHVALSRIIGVRSSSQT